MTIPHTPTKSTFPVRLLQTGAATAVAAVVGIWATDPKSAWYRSLSLPAWKPVRVVFPAVWTGIYAGLAVTSAAVLARHDMDASTGSAQARDHLVGYERALAVNLALNAGWSLVFWRARNPTLANVEAGALAASAAVLARRAAVADRKLGLSLIPYVVWAGFAKSLSSKIAKRNPGRMG